MITLETRCAVGLLFAWVSLAAHANSPATADIEARIQRVTAGLIDGYVIAGDAHAKHRLDDRMRELHVPAVSIAVIHNGRIDWARGFGTRQPSGAAVDQNTLFQAASISKPLTAMAALHLVQEGKLSLDADINRFLRSWKLPNGVQSRGKAVTLRELLTHTGGISVHGFPGYAAGEPVPALIQVLNGEKPSNTQAIRRESEAGKEWNYSGGGYTIIQQTLLDITDEQFPALMRQMVLDPIGMSQSTYEQPLPISRQKNAAIPYREDGSLVPGGAHTYPEMAAAGLWTTPSDLALYAIELQQSLKGRAHHVLSFDMTRQMLTAGIGGWGLGLQIGGNAQHPYFAHDGANEGFQCTMFAYVNDGDGAVIMTNSNAGWQINESLLRSIAAEYGWPDHKAVIRKTISIAPRELKRLEGTYELTPQFKLRIVEKDGQLIVTTAGLPPFVLYPESPTKFFSTTLAADIEFPSAGNGQVNSLTWRQDGQELRGQRTP